jgi:hypothetical protein
MYPRAQSMSQHNGKRKQYDLQKQAKALTANSRVPAFRAQSPEFKNPSPTKKKKKQILNCPDDIDGK